MKSFNFFIFIENKFLCTNNINIKLKLLYKTRANLDLEMMFNYLTIRLEL